jgi:hypothetical protein
MVNERIDIVEEGVIFDEMDIEEMEAVVAPGLILSEK